MSAVPTRLVGGRYRLEVPLGQGNEGAVWRAVDAAQGDAPCAVKMLARPLRAAEGVAWMRIEHPRVVRTRDVGGSSTEAWVVMDLVEGDPLVAAMGADAVARAARDAADGLCAVHAVGLVHGDVKPANILVGPAGATLVDLGVAGPAGSSALVDGTPAYLAPEAFAGDRSAATDLYALGVTLFEAFGGGHPFVADASDARSLLVAAARPTPLRADALACVPEALRSLVGSLVAWDPADRPASAAAFVHRWTRALGAPVGALLDLDAVPASPRWRGDARDPARLRALLGDALAGRGAVLRITGPEGSGRRRLVEDTVRALRIERAALDAPVSRVDGPPCPHAGPTIFVLWDASPAVVAEVTAAVARARRYGLDAPAAVVVTSAPGVSIEGVAEFAMRPLDDRCLGALLEDLHGAPVAAAVLARWRGATGSWAGTVVRTARELGASAIAEFRGSPTLRPAHVAPGGDGAGRVLALLCAAGASLPLAALDLADQEVANALAQRGLVHVSRGLVRSTASAAVGSTGEADALRRVADRLRELRTAAAAEAGLRVSAGDTDGAWAAAEVFATDETEEPAARLALIEDLASTAPAPARVRAARLALRVRGGHTLAAADLDDAPDDSTRTLLEGEALLRAGAAAPLDAWLARVRSGTSEVAASVVGLRAAYDRGEVPTETEVAAVSSAGAPLLEARRCEIGALAAVARREMEAARRWLARWDSLPSSVGIAASRREGVGGLVAQADGDLSAARSAYARAWELASRDGDARAAAAWLMNLGAVGLERGDLGEARGALRRAAAMFGAAGSTAAAGRAVANLASLSVWIGERDDAAALLAVARQDAEAGNDPLTARWTDAIERELSSFDATSELPGAALRALGAGALAADADARWVLGAVRAGAEEAALRGLPPAADGDGPLTELARWACAVRFHPRRGSVEAAEARARRAVESDPSVEHELLLLACTEEAAEAAGDIARADVLRTRRRDRVDTLARSLPEALRPAFVAAHGPRVASRRPEASSAASVVDARWRWMLAVLQRLLEEPRLPALLDRVMDAVIELTGASRGLLLLRERDGTLRVRNARNLGARDLADPEAAVSRTIAERVAREGSALVTVDAATDGRIDGARSVVGLRLRSVLAVPLRVRGEVLGTLYVDDRLRAGAFDERAVELAQAFADAAALAIDHARSRAALRTSLRRSEQLAEELERSVAQQRAELETARAAAGDRATRGRYGALVGRGDAMRAMLALVDRVAPTAMPVLLQGESGTGKELVARAVHENSPRAARAFVAENCGAIPETLLESTLFGHVRGAFTGADRPRAGLFEAADGGTLFLDEIGEMSASMQSRLLRVLQDGEVRPVGGDKTRRVDVRVIAATHRDLQDMVARGLFREDLYYRLAVLVVRVPALRDRREDVPELVAHFLRESARPSAGVDRAALAALSSAPWPGNVRQLRNEVLRAVVLSEDTIRPEHLTVAIAAGARPRTDAAPGSDLRNAVEDVERTMVVQALAAHGGNQTRAAKALGLSRFGLQKKLRRLGITARPTAAREG